MGCAIFSTKTISLVNAAVHPSLYADCELDGSLISADSVDDGRDKKNRPRHKFITELPSVKEHGHGVDSQSKGFGGRRPPRSQLK